MCVCVSACVRLLAYVCLYLCVCACACMCGNVYPFIICVSVLLCLYVSACVCAYAVLLHVGLGQHRLLTAPWPGPQVWPLQEAGAHVGRAVHEGVPGCVGGQGGQGGLHGRTQPLQQILGECHGGVGGHSLATPSQSLLVICPRLCHGFDIWGSPLFP